jgi:hypothetical protein
MDTASIELALIRSRYFDYRKDLIVPNVDWGLFHYEHDLVVLKASDYAYEIEIKRTLSDLKKDLEKSHKHVNNKIRKLYFAFPSKLAKHIKFVPIRAGIFVVNKEGKVYKIKEADVNKKAVRFTEEERYKLARLGALRIWNLKSNLKIALNQNKELREELKNK